MKMNLYLANYTLGKVQTIEVDRVTEKMYHIGERYFPIVTQDRIAYKTRKEAEAALLVHSVRMLKAFKQLVEEHFGALEMVLMSSIDEALHPRCYVARSGYGYNIAMTFEDAVQPFKTIDQNIDVTLVKAHTNQVTVSDEFDIEAPEGTISENWIIVKEQNLNK